MSAAASPEFVPVAREKMAKATPEATSAAPPHQNDHREFVGLAALKREHAEQLAEFESWATAKKWQTFHRSHYDWWVFPYSEPSSHAFAYTIFEREAAELRKDGEFMARYLRAAELVFRAWGWHLREARPLGADEIDNARSQRWSNWPIRLFKATRSLLLMGCTREAASALRYGGLLLARGEEDFGAFGGKDLRGLFAEPPLDVDAALAADGSGATHSDLRAAGAAGDGASAAAVDAGGSVAPAGGGGAGR